MITLVRVAYHGNFRTNEYVGKVQLYYPCYKIYLVDTVNVATSSLLCMSNVGAETSTKVYLTATFDIQNGTYITLTNNHAINAMFINYGCDDLMQTAD